MVELSLSNFNVYFTVYNGDRPYVVYVSKSKDHVIVMQRPDDVESTEHTAYTHLVENIHNPLKIWLGNSPKMPMTEFSGGYGKHLKGNTVLIQLSKYRYMYVGFPEVYRFTIPKRDQIVKYISPVGNNEVPYAFAYGKKYLYYMMEKKYVELKYIRQSTRQKTIDMAVELSGFFNSFDGSKPEISLPEFYSIQQKSIDKVSFKTIKQIAKQLGVVVQNSKRKTVDMIEFVTRIKLFN